MPKDESSFITSCNTDHEATTQLTPMYCGGLTAASFLQRYSVAQGLPYVATIKDFGGTAYGWAMEDETSFCKLIAHRDTRQLLGAHIIGPQASTLIQPLIQAMRFGQTVDELARDVWYIHPALSEVVENALLDL